MVAVRVPCSNISFKRRSLHIELTSIVGAKGIEIVAVVVDANVLDVIRNHQRHCNVHRINNVLERSGVGGNFLHGKLQQWQLC